jgi:hypothetical protein
MTIQLAVFGALGILTTAWAFMVNKRLFSGGTVGRPSVLEGVSCAVGARVDLDAIFGHGEFAFDQHPHRAVGVALEDEHLTWGVCRLGKTGRNRQHFRCRPDGRGAFGGAPMWSVPVVVAHSVPTRGLHRTVIEDLEGGRQFLGEQVDPATGDPAAA